MERINFTGSRLDKMNCAYCKELVGDLIQLVGEEKLTYHPDCAKELESGTHPGGLEKTLSDESPQEKHNDDFKRKCEDTYRELVRRFGNPPPTISKVFDNRGQCFLHKIGGCPLCMYRPKGVPAWETHRDHDVLWNGILGPIFSVIAGTAACTLLGVALYKGIEALK